MLPGLQDDLLRDEGRNLKPNDRSEVPLREAPTSKRRVVQWNCTEREVIHSEWKLQSVQYILVRTGLTIWSSFRVQIVQRDGKLSVGQMKDIYISKKSRSEHGFMTFLANKISASKLRERINAKQCPKDQLPAHYRSPGHLVLMVVWVLTVDEMKGLF